MKPVGLTQLQRGQSPQGGPGEAYLARAVPPRGSGGFLLGVGRRQNPHELRVALSCWFVSRGPNRRHNVGTGEGSGL
jgi:hypothetical protein